MKKRKRSDRWLHDLLHKAAFIDDFGLILMTCVDLAITVVFFLSWSIDILTTIGLVALGFIIPLIKVRAWLKHKVAQAVIWALITFFTGVNFMLTTVTIQSDTQSVPQYLTDAKTQLKSLQDQQALFRTQSQRTNANSMQVSIDAQQAVVTQDEQRTLTESGKLHALQVFDRIPQIFTKPSAAILIALLIFSAIFLGIEFTIYGIATELSDEKLSDSPRKIIMEPLSLKKEVDDELYLKVARQVDGTVLPPEEAASLVGISVDEANRRHGKLFPGYVFKNGRYVRLV